MRDFFYPDFISLDFILSFGQWEDRKRNNAQQDRIRSGPVVTMIRRDTGGPANQRCLSQNLGKYYHSRAWTALESLSPHQELVHGQHFETCSGYSWMTLCAESCSMILCELDTADRVLAEIYKIWLHKSPISGILFLTESKNSISFCKNPEDRFQRKFCCNISNWFFTLSENGRTSFPGWLTCGLCKSLVLESTMVIMFLNIYCNNVVRRTVLELYYHQRRQ